MRAKTIENVESSAAMTAAEELVAAVERTHQRDLEMIAAGTRKQTDLLLIKPAVARRSKVRWTTRATVGFRL